MATYYPSNNPHSQCTKCNQPQSFPNGTNGTNGSDSSPGSQGKNNKQPCSVYCDVASNNKCDSKAQTFCNLNRQYIKNHADVGAYPIDQISKDDIIYHKWTATKWNSLIQKLNTAGRLGATRSQGGAGPSIKTISEDDIITADIYNKVEEKIANFNTSYPKVKGGPEGTIISATIANAMRTAYNNATFNASVCDICNTTSRQTPGECGCNCPTCSQCPNCTSCPSCSCPCNCYCNCTCGSCYCASCPVGCAVCSSCSKPTTTTK